MTETYALGKKNKLRQLKPKARYDKATVHAILDGGLVAHVGLVDDGHPVVVPMIFGRDGETLYLHGAKKSRIVRRLSAGAQVCISVVLLDGLVVARSAFNSSMNYRSVTVFGEARPVEDQERLHALQVISEHILPGRWQELRPPTTPELKQTGVLRVVIQEASAKVADDFPDDEPEDYDLPVWAGVVPLTTTFGEPLADDRIHPDAGPSAAAVSLAGRRM